MTDRRGAIISGIGISNIGRRTGTAAVDLTISAARQAIADAGAILVSDDKAYSPTSGVAGFLDTGSTATRSNPPDAIRGQAVIDASKQIVSQTGRQTRAPKVPRRKTRSQP